MSVAKRFGGLGLAAMVAMAGLTVEPSTAVAQIRVMATAGAGMFGDSQVSKRSVERYAEILGLSPEQKESALAIHEGYAAAMKDAQKTRRAAIDEMRKSSEDTGDSSVFMEKMPAVEKEYSEKARKLEKGLFEDMKSLLSGPAQEGKWVRVERMRRREVELRSGGVSGESVDITDVVTGLKLPAEVMATLAAPLDDYEAELDHQLQAKAKLKSDDADFSPVKAFDPEKMKKQMQEAREAGLKVKEVNDRAARKIEPLLPEDKRTAFRDAIKERSFPQVYRPSHAARDVDAALKLDDLSPSQKSTLADIRTSYAREAAALNDAWAAAIAASEGDGSTGVMVGPGGSHIVLNMGEDPPALTSARKARRELDDKTKEKLKSALNEAQQTKVEKASTNDDEGEAGVAVRSIMLQTEDHPR